MTNSKEPPSKTEISLKVVRTRAKRIPVEVHESWRELIDYKQGEVTVRKRR